MRTETSKMNGRDAVELEHVTRTYVRENFEVRALDDVTLRIPEHSFAGIMGPSGSGKTTLLKLITGIDQSARSFSFIPAICSPRTETVPEVGWGELHCAPPPTRLLSVPYKYAFLQAKDRV